MPSQHQAVSGTSHPFPCVIPSIYQPSAGALQFFPIPSPGQQRLLGDLHSGQTGPSQDPVQLWGGDLESWTVGTVGARNLHGQMVSETLAADSSSCGDQQCPHGPDVGLTHLPPAVVDLQRTSQPISEKHKIVAWKGAGGPPSTSNGGSLAGSVLGLQGCLDSRGHSWAERVYWGRWGRSPPWSSAPGFCPET